MSANFRALLAVICALCALTLAGCASDGDESEEGGSASRGERVFGPGVYLSRLSGWKEEPKLMLSECEKIDPPGIANRRAIYNKWLNMNAPQLQKIEQYMAVIPPRLYPEHGARGETAEDFFRSKTMLDLNQLIFFTPPEEKQQRCLAFGSTGSMGPDNLIPGVGESFAFIDSWLSRNAR